MVYWAPILHFYQPPTQFPARSQADLRRVVSVPSSRSCESLSAGRATVNNEIAENVSAEWATRCSQRERLL